ncbi:MAG: nucleoside deaminase [Anaerovoracaceae bacterium]
MEEISCSAISKDEYFMDEAIREAEIAASEGEVPVGAVIVRDGVIIARAHNLVETLESSSAHAEMIAMHRAETELGVKWLTGCTLYATLEPCAMCAGAMVLARIERLCIGTMYRKRSEHGLALDIVQSRELNHRIEVSSGIREEECGRLLSGFFRRKRAEKAAARRAAADENKQSEDVIR